jgi:hypothetical protein
LGHIQPKYRLFKGELLTSLLIKPILEKLQLLLALVKVKENLVKLHMQSLKPTIKIAQFPLKDIWG